MHRALRFTIRDDGISIGRYGEWGWIEGDPTAEDSFNIHLPNTHIEWCCQYWLPPGQFEPDTKYDVFARIRVDRKGDQGAAFWAGTYDAVNSVALGTVQPNVKDIPDNDSHLCKLGTIMPAQGQYVWCGPYGSPGSVGGVWLDYCEVRAAD
jgi:hypothetical protein